MKSPQSRLFLIVGLGWFATAAIAFCIGRIGAPTVGNEEASRAADRTGAGVRGTGDIAGTADAAGVKGQFAMGEGDGPLTVARVTNGQPLEKWIKRLMEQQDSMVRMNGLLRLLDAVRDPEDIKTLLGAINLRGDRGFGRGARFTEYSMILEKFTQLDPKGAIGYVNSKGREEKWIGTSAVMQTWTRTDPTGAIAWAQGEGKEKADSPSGPGGPGGPGGGPPGFTSSPISIVLTQLAHTDLDKAMSVASAETFDRRSRTLDTIATELVGQRGLDGARSALDGMAGGSLRDGLITQLAGKFAEKDAPSAASWALGLPEGDAKSRALADTVSEWAKKDAAAAGAFMASLPATPEADRSRESYASAVAQKDPQGALAWAGAITDKDRQQRTVENVARTWVKQDAAAAKAWIAQSSLPDEVKARIQSPGRGRGRGPGN